MAKMINFVSYLPQFQLSRRQTLDHQENQERSQLDDYCFLARDQSNTSKEEEEAGSPYKTLPKN